MNVDQFRAAIRSAGLEPPEIIEPGRLLRFSTNGKGSDDAGWCKLFGDCQGGVFGDFRAGLSETWQAEKPFTQVTQAEREAFRQRCAAERKEREAEAARRHAGAREKAAEILAVATMDPVTHPYSILKRVSFGPLVRRGAWPQRGWSDALLIPIYDGDGRLWSIEAIDSDGDKDFLAGGRIGGGFHPFGQVRGAHRVLIGEGLASVAACVVAESSPAVAALSASNLKAVALAVREIAPDAEIILLADNDANPEGGNPGLHAAQEAAAAVGGRVAIPELEGRRKCDFWDLWHERGAEAVQRAIARAEAPGTEGATAHATGEAEDLHATVRRLAAMSPVAYDRARIAEAEQLGVRVTTLDAEVEKAGGGVSIQGQAVVFDDPDPWPDEVDGAATINGASETLSRRLAVPDGAADAMALWTTHAHCHTAFLHSPRLNITSPEKGCGKTLALDVLYSLAPKGIRTESITTAVLFRIVDKFTPTLFIDEYDAFIYENEELRGALNAGHKRGGMHLRCEGDKNEVRGFRTFAPVALAGIRELPGTLADRSIVIRMQRMAADEHREPFDQRRTEPEKILCRKLARWARDNFKALEAADPEMPAGAGHRVRDNWRPLFAIADQAGGDWPARVRRAFALLAKPDDAARSRAEMLLGDFRDMFAEHGDRILSADAVKWLGAMEERPWPEYSRGKPITARQVAAALRRFEIKPIVIRTGTETPRGYVKEHFINAFSRYLPGEGGDRSATPQQDRQDAGRSDFRSATSDPRVADRDPLEPAPQQGCCGVADPNPPPWGTRL